MSSLYPARSAPRTALVMAPMWITVAIVGLLWGCSGPDVRPDRAASTSAPVLNPLSGGRVPWRLWAARDSAQAYARPILLFLYSQRSFWCRDLVTRCFQDADLSALAARVTLPVWVDVDRRPDVFERYGVGGVPTVAFLTSDGRWITGTTCPDPDDLQDLMRRVLVLFDNPKRMESLESQREELLRRAAVQAQRNPRPVLRLDRVLMQRVVDSMQTALTAGRDIGAEGLRALAVSKAAYRAGQDALGRLAQSRRRASDGTFFLSELASDGAVLDREMHLGVNAGLLLAFAEAAKTSDRTDLKSSARQLGSAMLNRFASPGDSLLCAGWADFAADSTGQIPRDPALYAGWNGLAASGLARLYQATGERRFLDAGRRILGGLKARFRRPNGLFAHVESGDGPVFLADQALIARAALDLFAADGRAEDLKLARDLADGMLKAFAVGGSGALKDRAPEPGEAVSPAVDRWLPSGNGVAAQVLVRLSEQVNERAYRRAAERILKGLIGPHIDRAAYLGALNLGLVLYLETA